MSAIPQDDPFEVFERLDVDDAGFPQRWRRFMEECCARLRDLLPAEAERWIETAGRYRRGEVPQSDLDAARAEAWTYLGPRSCDFGDPHVNAVRAVLFLLYPDPRPDRREFAEYFLEFCEDTGLKPSELAGLLTEAFHKSSGV